MAKIARLTCGMRCSLDDVRIRTFKVGILVLGSVGTIGALLGGVVITQEVVSHLNTISFLNDAVTPLVFASGTLVSASVASRIIAYTKRASMFTETLS